MLPEPSSPLNIVLSCNICYDTLATIYAEQEWSQLASSANANAQNSVPPRLFLTECAHLICMKHLHGQALSSIKGNGQRPRAPCPRCVERGDVEKKRLFFITGVAHGDYDEEIPETYFQMPPPQLNVPDEGDEALRFHYLSLIHFGTKTREQLLQATDKLVQWENRRPGIVRSIGQVAHLKEALVAAGRQLFELQQDTSSVEAALKEVGLNASFLSQSTHSQRLKRRSGGFEDSLGGKRLLPLNNQPSHRSLLASASAQDLDQLKQTSSQRRSNVADGCTRTHRPKTASNRNLIPPPPSTQPRHATAIQKPHFRTTFNAEHVHEERSSGQMQGSLHSALGSFGSAPPIWTPRDVPRDSADHPASDNDELGAPLVTTYALASQDRELCRRVNLRHQTPFFHRSIWDREIIPPQRLQYSGPRWREKPVYRRPDMPYPPAHEHHFGMISRASTPSTRGVGGPSRLQSSNGDTVDNSDICRSQDPRMRTLGFRNSGLSSHMRSSGSTRHARVQSWSAGSGLGTPMSSPHFRMPLRTSDFYGDYPERRGQLYVSQMQRQDMSMA